MAVDTFVRYSSLRLKGRSEPIIPQGQISLPVLARSYSTGSDLYLQSVPRQLADQNVAADWGTDVIETLVNVSMRASRWRAELARAAYRWLNAKTENATKLFWWNDLVMHRLEKGQRSQGDLPRLALPPEIRQAALENYERSSPGTTYYHRIVPDGRFLCLQYWFFYGYNDWATTFGGMNDHEGDWEGMYLFFERDDAGRPQEPPAYLTYVGHHSRLTKPWGHPDVTLDGTHPVAYVAAGSHATYPERKEYDLIKIYGLTDYATGGGKTIEPGDWQHKIDLDTQPWASAFLGGWGTRYWLPLSWARDILGFLRTRASEIGLPGVSAPRGPRYSDDGTIRPNWTQAATWAGIFDLERR
jgi:hypothetical protein